MLAALAATAALSAASLAPPPTVYPFTPGADPPAGVTIEGTSGTSVVNKGGWDNGPYLTSTWR